MQFDWWTLAIQTVNVAILVWLLQRFFWRPVSAMIERRRANTETALAEAKAATDKATAAQAEVEKTRAGFAREHDAILKQAHDAAAKASAATLEDTSKTVAAQEAAGAAAIASAHDNSEKAWAAHTCLLAADMAGRLAQRLEGPAVQASFLGWLLEQLRTLPEPARHATGGAPLEAISATPIDAAGQARTTGLIADALGATPLITYRTDPALIAGLELHGPHLLVANSWQADLAKMRVEAGA